MQYQNKRGSFFSFIKHIAVAIFFVLALLLPQTMFAQTIMSGTIGIDTTWTQASGPYIIQSDFTIPTGVTLTIEEGTVVKFQGSGTELFVNGTLQVNGTALNNVYFTSVKDDTIGGDTNGDGSASTPGVGDWRRVLVSGSGIANIDNLSISYSGSTFGYPFRNEGVLNLDGVIISNAGGVNGVFSLGTLTVTNSDIGGSTTGIYVGNGSANISNNSIHDNTLYGVYLASGTATITNNTFTNNGLDFAVNPNLSFTYSGNTSTGASRNGILVNGSSIGDDTTWVNIPNLPYIIQSDFTIPTGVTLTIEEGTVVKFQGSGTELFVNGTLQVNGTALNNVYFTSVKDDTIGGDTNGDGSASTPGVGDWRRVLVSGSGIANIDNLSISYSGSTFGYPFRNEGVLNLDGVIISNAGGVNGVFSLGTLTVTNSDIGGSTTGIYVGNGSANISNNSIHDNGSFGVQLAGGSADARNNWWGDASGPYNATLNPGGLGNAVSDNVDFIPFLTSEPVFGGGTPPPPPPPPTNPNTIKIAVILAEPSNRSFSASRDKTYYDTILIPQVKDYWCEVSFGQRAVLGNPMSACSGGQVEIDITLDDIFNNGGNNYKLAQTDAYYGEDSIIPKVINIEDGQGVNYISLEKDRTLNFLWDAINSADADINYNNYDAVIVIHSERAEESYWEGDIDYSERESKMNTFFWKRSPYLLSDTEEQAKNLIIMSADQLTGVWAHELGHVVGKIKTNEPLYDLYGGFSTSPVIGDIFIAGLMGSGSTLGLDRGSNPAHLSSFNKRRLGWLNQDFENISYGPSVVKGFGSQQFGDKVQRFNVSGLFGESYYLLEAQTRDDSIERWNTKPRQGEMPPSEDSLVVYKVREVNLPGKTIEIVNFMNFVSQIGTSFKSELNSFEVSPVNFVKTSSSFDVEVLVTDPLVSNSSNSMAMLPELSLLSQFPDSELLSLFNKGTSYKVGVSGSSNLARVYPGTPANVILWTDVVRPIFLLLILVTLLILLRYIYLKFSLRKLVLETSAGAKSLHEIRMTKIIIFALLFAIVVLGTARIPAIGDSYANLLDISPMSLEEKALKFNSFAPSFNEVSLADIDLHAITPEGLHVGVNYETGEYENQIAGALSSGDLLYDEEWISVPEGTEVEYYVSSEDIGNFLAENPDVAAILTSTDEQYTLTAVNFDSAGVRTESVPLTNQVIAPDEIVVHEITVDETTGEIVVDPGVVDALPPVTTISLSGTTGSNGYYVSDVEVTLTATDDASGVAKTEYSLDEGGLWEIYTEPFAYSIEGTNNLLYRSIDELTNIEATQSVTISLDQTAPTIFASDASAEQLASNGTQLTVEATAEDNVDASPVLTSDIPLSQVFPAGVTDILLTATDQAGNVATSSIAVTIFSTPASDPDGDGIPNQDDVKPFDPEVFANITLANEYSYWAKKNFDYPFSVAGVGEVKVSFSKIYYKLKAEEPVMDDAGNIIPTTVIEADGVITLSFIQATKENANYVLRIKTKKGNKKQKEKIKKKKKDEDDDEKKDELEKELKFVEAPITVSVTASNGLILEESSAVTIYDKKKKASIHYKYKKQNNVRDAKLILKTDDEVELAKGQPMVFTVKVTGVPKTVPFTAGLSGNFTLIDVVDEKEYKNGKKRKQKRFSFFYPTGYASTTDTITIDMMVDGISRTDTLIVELEEQDD